MPENYKNMKDLKAKMWAYIENILNNEAKYQPINPQTMLLDQAQNSIMDINFGLNDLGRLRFMLDMANMLTQKKKAEAQIKDHPDKRDELQVKID